MSYHWQLLREPGSTGKKNRSELSLTPASDRSRVSREEIGQDGDQNEEDRINTGGGDAPGLNAVIRAIVLAAVNRGWKCYGIREGYLGLLEPQDYPEGGLFKLTRRSVRGITHLGGTILGTTNLGNPLKYPMTDKNGQTREVDRTDYLVEALREHKIDTLISI